jgi:hypothetical protein
MYSVSSDAEYKFDDVQEYPKGNLQHTIRAISPHYEIFYIIQSTGADFNPTIINDYKKYESYTISAKKSALNLGVYSTDIGYLSAYGKTQLALNYLDVCLELTKTVCSQDAVDFNVLERFEYKLSNPDSLNQILNQFNINIITYLNENEHRNFGVLILGGIFIEVLYIATQIVDNYPKNLLSDDVRKRVLSPLVCTLADLKVPLKKIIELLESVDGKEELELVIINRLQDLYDNYPEFDLPEQITEGRPSEVLDDGVFFEAVGQISNIRATIVF